MSRRCVLEGVEIRLVQAALVSLVMVVPAHALLSVGAPGPISSHAFLDDPTRLEDGNDTEGSPKVAGDGAGNWIGVWQGNVGPPLGEPGGSTEIWMSRSSDNGRSWTAAAALEVTPGGDSIPRIVTDRAGVWETARRRAGSVVVSRSIDNGATWTGVFEDPDLANPNLATDESGVWILATDNGLTHVFVSRSIDGGQTWGSPFTLDTDDVGNVMRDRSPAIATDRSGNWIVTWRREDVFMSSLSVDNGVTWEVPQEIGDAGFEYFTSAGPSVATNGLGQWIAAWESRPSDASDHDSDLDIYYTVSSDNGATWTPPAGLFGPPSAEFSNESNMSVSAADDGTFYMAFDRFQVNTAHDDSDVFISRSHDGGYTWTTPAYMSLPGRKDGQGSDGSLTLGFDGNGSWIAAWSSDNTLGGTIGEDNDILFTRSHDDCPTTPASGCILPTRPGSSRIALKDDLTGNGDRLTWTWSAGGETTPDDLGDPTISSGYALCLYDEVSGTLRSVFEIDAEAAVTCAGLPCWRATSSGYAYGDLGQENGAMRSLTLEAGEAGRSKIKLKATGPSVAPPRFPLSMSPSVVAQLHSPDTGKCWEATYSTSILNDATRFKARSD